MLVCYAKTSLIRIVIVHALWRFAYISRVAYFGIWTHRSRRLALLFGLVPSWRLRISDKLFRLRSNSDRTQRYRFTLLWDNRIVFVMFEIVDLWSLNFGIWAQNLATILLVYLLISKIRFHLWLVHRFEWGVVLVGCRRRIRLENGYIWHISDSLHQQVGPSWNVIQTLIQQRLLQFGCLLLQIKLLFLVEVRGVVRVRSRHCIAKLAQIELLKRESLRHTVQVSVA